MMKRSIITVIRIIGSSWCWLYWIGRLLLDANPTKGRMTWVTIIVHYTLMVLFGIAIFKAIQLVQISQVWAIPVPSEIGLILMVLTGAIVVLTVVNLALQGLGCYGLKSQ